MIFVKLSCALCNKSFLRRKGQAKEAEKFAWRQFCSPLCHVRSQHNGAHINCSNLSCRKRFYRAKNQIQKVKRSFCSSRCVAVFYNAQRSAKLPPSICRNPSCKLPISRNKKFCSPQHRINPRKLPEDVYKKRIIERILTFYKQHGRIPVKREMYGIYQASRRLFGTWNEAVRAANLQPNPVRFADRCMANDGHVCDSVAEKMIDDLLFSRKIKHKRNVPYPNTSYTADFQVSGRLIEFFGLRGELKEYDRHKRAKEALARKHNLTLVKIYPEDIYPLHKLEHTLITKILK